MNHQKIRVRFAPSPTGPLHIGGVRTALYNYLFSRHLGGTYILRIEDTDQQRYVPGAEQYIIESLQWCGIQFDEGVHVGGPYGPYRQSERKAIYHDFAMELVFAKHAYYAFDTQEDLERIRKDYEKDRLTFNYDATVRMRMKNSLSLTPAETSRRLASGEPYVIRFRIPENETLVFNDLIRGEISVNTSLLDDKVLFKSDGMPTYHLANIVDDHLMEVSHVIRGEEWLPSLPLHVLLYRSFGWQSPEFAHLPLILKPEGSGKLSKRDGDRLGFPVFPLEWQDPFTGDVSSGYRESGYFPEAVVNMLALLGWNPGTEQELFDLEELSRLFSLERVGRSGSRFDPSKARWFNHQVLLRKGNEELTSYYLRTLKDKGFSPDPAYVNRIVAEIKERADFVSDFWSHSDFFFTRPAEYEEAIIRKRWKDNIPQLMAEMADEMSKLPSPLVADAVKPFIEAFAQQHAVNPGVLMNTLRLCLVGGSHGPDLSFICEMLGQQEIKARVDKAREEISEDSR